MEISYLGHACFKLKGKSATVIFDPFDPSKTGLKLSKAEGDIVCVSHSHFDHNFVEGVRGMEEGKKPFVISAPGEYDLKGVYISGYKTFHDDQEGKERGTNTIYYVEMDGLFILHLGDLGHMLQNDIVEELETVDVLLVPVGGFYTIDYKVACDVIAELEPSYVVPMHFRNEKLTFSGALELDPLDKFTKEWGSDVVKTEAKLKISSRSELPDETEVVVLEQA